MLNSSMFVLVNGSSTMDFKVSIGFRQGDPFSLFLFLLVAKGFAYLVHHAISLGKFEGFHFNDNTHFELLQFEDDISLIGDGSWRNLWKIKALLRGFKLCRGFR